mgnify:CR=1 FL=1
MAGEYILFYLPNISLMPDSIDDVLLGVLASIVIMVLVAGCSSPPEVEVESTDYFTKAIQESNPDYCRKLSRDKARYACFINLSRELSNPSLCGEITSSLYRQHCLGYHQESMDSSKTASTVPSTTSMSSPSTTLDATKSGGGEPKHYEYGEGEFIIDNAEVTVNHPIGVYDLSFEYLIDWQEALGGKRRVEVRLYDEDMNLVHESDNRCRKIYDRYHNGKTTFTRVNEDNIDEIAYFSFQQVDCDKRQSTTTVPEDKPQEKSGTTIIDVKNLRPFSLGKHDIENGNIKFYTKNTNALTFSWNIQSGDWSGMNTKLVVSVYDDDKNIIDFWEDECRSKKFRKVPEGGTLYFGAPFVSVPVEDVDEVEYYSAEIVECSRKTIVDDNGLRPLILEEYQSLDGDGEIYFHVRNLDDKLSFGWKIHLGELKGKVSKVSVKLYDDEKNIIDDIGFGCRMRNKDYNTGFSFNSITSENVDEVEYYSAEIVEC